jgi:hypothetical protein
MNAPTERDLIGFVVHEARLLDELRFDEWLELFTEDGRYWMPLEYGQTDPILRNSLFYDDKLLLKIRVERLKKNLQPEAEDAMPSRPASADRGQHGPRRQSLHDVHAIPLPGNSHGRADAVRRLEPPPFADGGWRTEDAIEAR